MQYLFYFFCFLVSLVERNKHPNGANIINLNTISIHESKDIVEMAQQIQRADESIKANACGKLSLILEQIKFLQSQAQKILEESEDNTNLHHVACNFQKVAGKIYHLYKRESGQTYFSMLSPEEWGSSLNHEFLGSYRLETDQSWTPLEKIPDTDRTQQWAQNLFKYGRQNNNMLTINDISDEMDM